MQYLELLNREDKMTIICSLHYLDLVQRYATKVIGLKEGELVYQGDKKDIRAMTDEQFKNIYGEEAERVGGGLEGDLQAGAGGAA
jgi:phosphonate transport system ATP-binding protein